MKTLLQVVLLFVFTTQVSAQTSVYTVSDGAGAGFVPQLISAESKKKPLSDEKLTQLLNEKGYNIARRTVAKYREQLDIPVARLRRQL